MHRSPLGRITQYWTLGRTFSDILDAIKNITMRSAELTQIREKFMVNRLPVVIQRTLEENEALVKKAKAKGNLRVLVALGAVHGIFSYII